MSQRGARGVPRSVKYRDHRLADIAEAIAAIERYVSRGSLEQVGVHAVATERNYVNESTAKPRSSHQTGKR
jgi:hypothetical protein